MQDAIVLFYFKKKYVVEDVHNFYDLGCQIQPNTKLPMMWKGKVTSMQMKMSMIHPTIKRRETKTQVALK